MYFPYLRGKQYELLSLRELSESNLISDKIIPIIEPIKLSSTLIKTLEHFIWKNKEIALIHNPQVGNFLNDIDQLKDNPIKEKYLYYLQNKLIIQSHMFNKNSNYELDDLYRRGIDKKDLLTISCNRDSLDNYTSEFSDNPPRYNLMPDESMYKRKIRKNKVLLDDKFEKQSRNTDYANIDDEFFSDDHLYYSDDGFVGFSDYSIVGSAFTESGFAPFAVAIHIIYFDSAKILRIKHFVSDSNDDINDPANKFYEAVTKLAKWQDEQNLNTLGIKKFMEYYNTGTYPGLGTVKNFH